MTFGPDRFLVGANLPWVGYGTDIGTGAWLLRHRYRCETARRSGYAAAFVWSVLADDVESEYPPELGVWLRA